MRPTTDGNTEDEISWRKGEQETINADGRKIWNALNMYTVNRHKKQVSTKKQFKEVLEEGMNSQKVPRCFVLVHLYTKAVPRRTPTSTNRRRDPVSYTSTHVVGYDYILNFTVVADGDVTAVIVIKFGNYRRDFPHFLL